jgi:hypothetical protein
MAAARFGWQQKRLNIAAGMFGVLWPDGLPFRNRPSQSGAPRSMKMGTIGSRWRGAGECEAVQERRFPDFKDIPMFRSLKKRRAVFAYWRRTATHWRLGLGFPLAISLAAVALVVAAHAQSAARAQEIWFHIGGMKMAHGHGAHGDWQVDNRQNWWDLLFFQPDAPWPETMNHVQVVGVLTQVMNQISDEDLAKVAKRLNQHHIAVALGLLATDNTPRPDAPARCGANVEGYDSPEETARIAAKLKRAGINLRYIAMDEPLWFGHYYNEKNACRSSIDNVAERVAANFAAYEKLFPEIVIGDTVPIPSLTDQPNWQNDYRQWREAFQAHTGRPLAFTVLDINWPRPNWTQSLQAMAAFLRNQHLRLGIIYNADAPPAMTNDEYLDAARQHFVQIEQSMRIVPDVAVFASWVRFTRHAITDASGRGQDYLVEQYVRPRNAR